jgi:hypothetical protein
MGARTRRGVAPVDLAVFVFFCAAACASGDGERLETARGAIVGGVPADAADSSTVYLQNPGGFCSAVVVAPTLVITARHCTAQFTDGPFDCTVAGDLVPNAAGAGQLGQDFAPSDITLFSSAHVHGGPPTGTPDATGVQILSTGSPSSCRDDLALVVIDHPIPNVVPAAVRIDAPTQVGERVSVWGYGDTDQPTDETQLRVREGIQIVGVGPTAPPATTQPAPLRAVRVGPGTATCSGDSGGPILSAATGAVIAVVSVGEQTVAPTYNACTLDDTASDTTGPLLSNYRDLILLAFGDAGASPISEAPDGGEADAALPASDAESESPLPASPDAEAAAPPPTTDSAPPYIDSTQAVRVTGGGCSTSATTKHVNRSEWPSALVTFLAAVVVARVKRRRQRREGAVCRQFMCASARVATLRVVVRTTTECTPSHKVVCGATRIAGMRHLYSCRS